jgi:hypothetical protein
MAGIVFGHGAWFTWGTMRITELLTFEWTGGKGETFEVTNRASRIIGVGIHSRVVRQYDMVSIEPTKLTLTFFGAPPAPGNLQDLAGYTELLTCWMPPNHSVRALATLDEWNWGCNGVAELQRGSMTFTFGNY